MGIENEKNTEDEILTDIAIQLLVLEGVPVLAFVYYLLHKKQMYLLEKGVEEKDDKKIRSERRVINGVFLVLAGVSMILAPKFASLVGIEAQLTFELLLASLVVLCAGVAMLVGEGLIRYKASMNKDQDVLAQLK